MYGMSVCGNNWFEELREWILSPTGGRFKQSTCEPVLLYRTESDGSTKYVLTYVDESLYFNSDNNVANRKAFEKEISDKFNRIMQDAQKNIFVDQSRYAKNITVKHIGQT